MKPLHTEPIELTFPHRNNPHHNQRGMPPWDFYLGGDIYPYPYLVGMGINPNPQKTWPNPYPWPWVWVWPGRGTGRAKIPQGYPC